MAVKQVFHGLGNSNEPQDIPQSIMRNYSWIYCQKLILKSHGLIPGLRQKSRKQGKMTARKEGARHIFPDEKVAFPGYSKTHNSTKDRYN